MKLREDVGVYCQHAMVHFTFLGIDFLAQGHWCRTTLIRNTRMLTSTLLPRCRTKLPFRLYFLYLCGILNNGAQEDAQEDISRKYKRYSVSWLD